MEQKKQKSLFRSAAFGGVFMFIVLFIMLLMFILSLALPKPTVSERENRTLATFPKFSVASYFSGEFNSGIDEHYSDTFPFRDNFLDVNDKIVRLTTQFTKGGEDDIVVINTGERDLGGEGFGDYENYEAEQSEEGND